MESKPQTDSTRNEPSHDPRTKIGQLLLQLKAITTSQLALALAEQKRLNASSKRKFKLGEILLFLKYIPMTLLHSVLLQQRPRHAEDALQREEKKAAQKSPGVNDTWGQ